MEEKLLLGQCKSAKNIRNFIKNAKKKTGQQHQTLSFFRAKLELLEQYWKKFFDTHSELLEESALADHEYFSNDVYQLTEDSYIEAKSILQDDIERLSSSRISPSPAGQSPPVINTMRSAPLTVPAPTFSGAQEDWESFKQRFTAFLQSLPLLTDVEKLQHLLNSVRGPAADRLKGIQIIGSNYQIAWQRLVRRFDHPQLRLSSHIESLLQLPHVRSRNSKDLAALVDSAEVIVQGLTDLECPISECSHFVVHLLLRKLDSNTQDLWHSSQENNEGFYKYKEFMDFLERRIRSMEQRTTVFSRENESKSSSKFNPRKSAHAIAANVAQVDSSRSSSKLECLFCKGAHWVYQCLKFKQKSQPDRYSFCKSNYLCLNCLGKNHSASKCPSTRRCHFCRGLHHTLLHAKPLVKADENKDASQSECDSSQGSVRSAAVIASTSIVAHSSFIGKSVLLATASVVVSNAHGASMTIRALIDPAAERSFISERISTLLMLPRNKASVTIAGVGTGVSARALGEATFTLHSRFDSNFALQVSALVLNEVSLLLPSSKIASGDWPHLRNLTLADDKFATPAKVDAILGADLYAEILREGLIKGALGTPLAQSTVFGWVLTGPQGPRSESDSAIVGAFHTRVFETLDSNLQKFWELEEVPQKRFLTAAEQECEDLFATTTTRDSTGRYIVRLPFINKPLFSDSRAVALACLNRSIGRRGRNKSLNEAYTEFMTQYESLGHMSPASHTDKATARCYLPHHPVFRNNDPKKIRVVFNASQKFASGLSLNDLLHPGPKLQFEVAGVISNWRFHPVVFPADIVKMFRQILVHPDDANWQHILWKEDASAPLIDFKLLTVTYGTAPAPFLAIRTLLQLASDGENLYPNAA